MSSDTQTERSVNPSKPDWEFVEPIKSDRNSLNTYNVKIQISVRMASLNFLIILREFSLFWNFLKLNEKGPPPLWNVFEIERERSPLWNYYVLDEASKLSGNWFPFDISQNWMSISQTLLYFAEKLFRSRSPMKIHQEYDNFTIIT